MPTLLYVDDSRTAHAYMQQILIFQLPDWTMDVAFTVDEALAKIEQSTPDLVVTDQHLGRKPEDKKGSDLVRLLREHRRPDLRNVRIAIHSSDPKVRWLQVKADGFLVKPVNPLEFKGFVAWLMSRPLPR